MSKRGALIFASTCLLVLSSVYAQYQLPIVADVLMERYGLSVAQYSSVFSSSMLSSVFLSIVLGILVDRFSPKPVILVCGVVCLIGAVARIWADGFAAHMACGLMIGVLATATNANHNKIFSIYLPADAVVGAVGVYCALGTLIQAVASVTTTRFPSLGSAFAFAAAFVAVAVVLWAAVVPSARARAGEDDPAGSKMGPAAQGSANEAAAGTGVLAGLKATFTSLPLWATGVMLGSVSTLLIIFGSFLPSMLMAEGMDSGLAGVYTAVVSVGSFAGAIAMPQIARKVGRDKPVMFCGLAAAALCALGVAFMGAGPAMLAVLFVAGFALGGSLPLPLALPVKMPGIGERYAGTALGLLRTIQLGLAVAVPSYVLAPLFGTSYRLYFVVGAAFIGACSLIALALPSYDEMR